MCAKSKSKKSAYCVTRSKTNERYPAQRSNCRVNASSTTRGHMSVSKTVSSLQNGSETRLQRNALSLGQIVASTLANIAPAMSFFFGFAVIVQGAGLAAPLTILTAMVAILFLTNTIAQFSRFTPSTGSFVTFTGKAFGPSVGAAVSVFITFGYIVAASTVVSIAGVWVADTLKIFLGLSINWAIL